ncbi:hypothetical protein SRABI128_05899 [Microbacterium sp. Bi128]|nr:hypothetical protein SRABI128_05899 [Microbacterium sp. Bi128]
MGYAAVTTPRVVTLCPIRGEESPAPWMVAIGVTDAAGVDGDGLGDALGDAEGDADGEADGDGEGVVDAEFCGVIALG